MIGIEDLIEEWSEERVKNIFPVRPLVYEIIDGIDLWVFTNVGEWTKLGKHKWVEKFGRVSIEGVYPMTFLNVDNCGGKMLFKTGMFLHEKAYFKWNLNKQQLKNKGYKSKRPKGIPLATHLLPPRRATSADTKEYDLFLEEIESKINKNK